MTDLSAKLHSVIENIPDYPKAGIQFKDITPIFSDMALYREVVAAFAEHSRGKIDVVCGIESRGFLFGISIASALDVPFVLVRKKGKLPPPVIRESYDLEYGSAEIEVRQGQIKPGQRVLIHDDLLATGGTTEAAAKLMEKLGAQVAQFSFLIELPALAGREKLLAHTGDILSLVSY